MLSTWNYILLNDSLLNFWCVYMERKVRGAVKLRRHSTSNCTGGTEPVARIATTFNYMGPINDRTGDQHQVVYNLSNAECVTSRRGRCLRGQKLGEAR